METKPQIKYMLDYGSPALWANDEISRNQFGYPIDLKSIGVSTEGIVLAQEIVRLLDNYLNPLYPVFPSFWSQKICDVFNSKVDELYKIILADIGYQYEIVNWEEKQYTEIPELEFFLNHPADYSKNKGISFGNESDLINEVTESYQKYLKFESSILSGTFEYEL